MGCMVLCKIRCQRPRLPVPQLPPSTAFAQVGQAVHGAVSAAIPSDAAAFMAAAISERLRDDRVSTQLHEPAHDEVHDAVHDEALSTRSLRLFP